MKYICVLSLCLSTNISTAASKESRREPAFGDTRPFHGESVRDNTERKQKDVESERIQSSHESKTVETEKVHSSRTRAGAPSDESACFDKIAESNAGLVLTELAVRDVVQKVDGVVSNFLKKPGYNVSAAFGDNLVLGNIKSALRSRLPLGCSKDDYARLLYGIPKDHVVDTLGKEFEVRGFSPNYKMNAKYYAEFKKTLYTSSPYSIKGALSTHWNEELNTHEISNACRSGLIKSFEKLAVEAAIEERMKASDLKKSGVAESVADLSGLFSSINSKYPKECGRNRPNSLRQVPSEFVIKLYDSALILRDTRGPSVTISPEYYSNLKTVINDRGFRINLSQILD